MISQHHANKRCIIRCLQFVNANGRQFCSGGSDNDPKGNALLNSSILEQKFRNLPRPPQFSSFAEERLHIRKRLAGAFRLCAQYGFDEGVAGHITVRDPEFKDRFWVNGFGLHFSQITASNLLCVSHDGKILEGDYPLNTAAFAIHSRLHMARPDVNAAAHMHSMYGKAFSSLGRPLDMISQDACAFYDDHVVFDDYSGVVVDLDEGDRIAKALGNKKAAILQSHGLLTVGETVDAAVWWYGLQDGFT